MKNVLFVISIKSGCLEQYKHFAKQTVERADEYREMLRRYDIHSARVWHHKIKDRDYVFVYHEIGKNFEERMRGWDTSEHPFDQWFRENMAACYDINNASEMEMPDQLVDFIV